MPTKDTYRRVAAVFKQRIQATKKTCASKTTEQTLREDVQKLQAQLTKIQSYISSDAYVIQFQSIGQYRQALLKLLREETA
jgi:hypothetical protein